MKLMLALTISSLLISPTLMGNTDICDKQVTHCQSKAAAGETLRLSVFDADGKEIRSHVMTNYTEGTLSLQGQQFHSKVLLGASDAVTTVEKKLKKPQQKVLDTFEAIEADGTLVMVMVIGYFKAGETTPFDVKVVESRFPKETTNSVAQLD